MDRVFYQYLTQRFIKFDFKHDPFINNKFSYRRAAHLLEPFHRTLKTLQSHRNTRQRYVIQDSVAKATVPAIPNRIQDRHAIFDIDLSQAIMLITNIPGNTLEAVEVVEWVFNNTTTMIFGNYPSLSFVNLILIVHKTDISKILGKYNADVIPRFDFLNGYYITEEGDKNNDAEIGPTEEENSVETYSKYGVRSYCNGCYKERPSDEETGSKGPDPTVDATYRSKNGAPPIVCARCYRLKTPPPGNIHNYKSETPIKFPGDGAHRTISEVEKANRLKSTKTGGTKNKKKHDTAKKKHQTVKNNKKKTKKFLRENALCDYEDMFDSL